MFIASYLSRKSFFFTIQAGKEQLHIEAMLHENTQQFQKVVYQIFCVAPTRCSGYESCAIREG